LAPQFNWFSAIRNHNKAPFAGDLIVLSLQRDGAIMIPHGDTVLQMQDRLGLLGRPASIEGATTILQR
jgi:Trk K+ transport system NAD-binding subunit